MQNNNNTKIISYNIKDFLTTKAELKNITQTLKSKIYDIEKNPDKHTIQSLEVAKKEYDSSVKKTESLKLFLYFNKEEVDYFLNNITPTNLINSKTEYETIFFEKHKIWIVKLLKAVTGSVDVCFGNECIYIYTDGKRPFGNSNITGDIAEAVTGCRDYTDEDSINENDYIKLITYWDTDLIYKEIIPRYFKTKILNSVNSL